MAARNFLIYIICSLVVVGIGIYLTLTQQNTEFATSAENFPNSGYQLVPGWHVIIMGVVMLLAGLVPKVIMARKDKKSSQSELNNE